jgi:hypothetical protein
MDKNDYICTDKVIFGIVISFLRAYNRLNRLGRVDEYEASFYYNRCNMPGEPAACSAGKGKFYQYARLAQCFADQGES